MLKLDHITVIAPTLIEGVSHVQTCLDLDVPFGARHDYMGTHNHRLQLGGNVYLEIVALDPDGTEPGRSRWFGLVNQEQVRSDWDEGRRLRGWVANTTEIDVLVSTRGAIFGDKVALPPANPEFAFAIPEDGSLPLDGAAPSIIDHQGDPTSMAEIPDLGARLRSFTLEHPDPALIAKLYRDLSIDHPPTITFDQRADLPAAWAGLTDTDFEEASGVKGAKFCHNARFIAVASTREAILKMAGIAVQEAQ